MYRLKMLNIKKNNHGFHNLNHLKHVNRKFHHSQAKSCKNIIYLLQIINNKQKQTDLISS